MNTDKVLSFTGMVTADRSLATGGSVFTRNRPVFLFVLALALAIIPGCTRKCDTDRDCSTRGRCNHGHEKAICQEPFSGRPGTPCSDNAFCESRFCDNRQCAAKCDGVMWLDGTECLPKGEGGAKCKTGEACKNGRCEGGYCWMQCTEGWDFEEGRCVDPRYVDWVRIVGGHFGMGANGLEAYPDERPVHDVMVRTFEIARSEVTVGQYKKCVRAGACTEPATDQQCNWGESGRDDHPVNCVDFDQASAYAKWVGGRLPTEAEWEFAARGGASQKWPWGDKPATCKEAVISDGGDGCGKARTWPVCSKKDGNTPSGLCDMSGNVIEWVQDNYHDSYEKAPSDGSAWLGKEAHRMSRGGSWYSESRLTRATVRFHYDPRRRLSTVGFRVARSVD